MRRIAIILMVVLVATSPAAADKGHSADDSGPPGFVQGILSSVSQFVNGILGGVGGLLNGIFSSIPGFQVTGTSANIATGAVAVVGGSFSGGFLIVRRSVNSMEVIEV